MLTFRNIDVSPDDHVSEWGVEGLLTAIERGEARHWDRIVEWAKRDDSPEFREALAEALDLAEGGGAAWIRNVLARLDESPKQRTLRRLNAAWRSSGLSRAAFAARLGTSGSRMSTYLNGSTTPSAEMLEAMEHLAQQLRDQRTPA